MGNRIDQIGLYFYPGQERGVLLGSELLREHLVETDLIKQCLSPEDPEVKDVVFQNFWPEHFKGRAVALWGKAYVHARVNHLKCLIRYKGQVRIWESPIVRGWFAFGPIAVRRQ